MLNRKGYKGTTIILLALILTFSSVMGTSKVYGESMFTDVDKKHWAYDYIENMVNMGLMDGYSDGSFKPNEKVNTADALVYITRIMNIPQDEVLKMREKHDDFLKKFNLTDKRKDGVAIALSKGLVTEKFVQNNLFQNGKLRNATKIEISVYLVRAMGMEEEAKKKVPIFFYNDTESIPIEARPYVKFLIDKKILDEKGDGEGRFNPNQAITRATLAKMLYMSHEQMNNSSINTNSSTNSNSTTNTINPPSKEPVGPPVVENENLNELAGIIVAKIDSFLLIDNGQKKDSYKISKDVQVSINGVSATIGELKEGMNIKAKVDKENVLESITVDNTSAIVSGTIKTISLGASPSMVVELKDENDAKTFYLSNETKISVDGKESYLFTLNEGDLVNIEAVNNLAINVTAESKNGEVEGILKDKNFDKEILLTVEREDKTTYEYTIKDNVTINRNLNKSHINDLRRGDKIKLSLDYGEVKSIDAESIKGEDEGYIKAILISEEPMLNIINNKGEMLDYYISKDVAVRIDKEIKGIYDLRLGYLVKLKLESDEIISLEAEKKTDINEFVGVVEYVNGESSFIILRNESTGEVSHISVSSKAVIKNTDGGDLELKDLVKGTKILITRSSDRGQFVAEKIIVVK